jgi:predicted methyltransferase
MYILSHIQVAPILDARQRGSSVARTSLDLGITTAEVAIQPGGAILPDGQRLSWEMIQEIAGQETVCFAVENGAIRKIQRFSPHLDRFYSLMPTAGAPTLLVAGFPMHRIKESDPQRDTRQKIATIAPLRGAVLDTATGLGYTAIAAAQTAQRVVTIELDPTVLEIARLNPWSRALFDNPKIEQLIGDAFERVQSLDDATFARIIHDPPTFRLAGELYSGAFYRQLFRVLKPGGRLFHYIGNLEHAAGHSVARGVIRRLQENGFARVIPKPDAFGIVAYKG